MSNNYLKPLDSLTQPPIELDWRLGEFKLSTHTISCYGDRQAQQTITDESIARNIIFRQSSRSTELYRFRLRRQVIN